MGVASDARPRTLLNARTRLFAQCHIRRCWLPRCAAADSCPAVHPAVSCWLVTAVTAAVTGRIATTVARALPHNRSSAVVRAGRFELPRVLPHQDLNLARLPIPPRSPALRTVSHQSDRQVSREGDTTALDTKIYNAPLVPALSTGITDTSAPPGTRTPNLPVKSRMLCQLS